jgi:hypothetical protein
MRMEPTGGVGVTVTIMNPIVLPPVPVHTSVNVLVVVRAPVDWLPFIALVPDQAPEAVQVVAFVEDQVSVADPPEVIVVGLAERVTVGVVTPMLLTVTFIDPDVPIFPAASRATAVSAWEPFEAEVVFQVILCGLVVSSAPRLAPSSLNCTPTIPMLSEAFALTATEDPDTVAPDVGAVIETVGEMMSMATTVVALTLEDCAELLPAAS